MLTTVIEQTTLIASRLQQRLSLGSPSETQLLYRPDESYYSYTTNAYWLKQNNTTEPTWFKSHLRQETRHTQHVTESMTDTMTGDKVRRGTPQITMNSVISEPSPESFVGGGRPNNEL